MLPSSICQRPSRLPRPVARTLISLSILRMALVVEEDEPSYLHYITLFCPDAIAQNGNHLTDMHEEIIVAHFISLC